MAITEMLTDFGVPVDLIYIAGRTETHSPFVEYCRGKGINPIIAEQHSAFSEKSAGRLYFPAIPRQLSKAFQEGEQSFSEILKQASPAVVASYFKAAAGFESALKEFLNG